MAIILVLAFAVVVTVSHARSLRRAQINSQAPREERLALWQKHQRVHGTIWVLLLIAIGLVEIFFTHPLITAKPLLGLPLVAAGLLLAVWSRRILGRAGAMGIRWFLPEDAGHWEARGPYRWLANPMYDGFLLIFLGLGIGLGIHENFFLALASLILLNACLARVESRGHTHHLL